MTGTLHLDASFLHPMRKTRIGGLWIDEGCWFECSSTRCRTAVPCYMLPLAKNLWLCSCFFFLHVFFSKTEVINSSKKHFRSFTAISTTLGGVMWPGVEPQRGIYNETYLRIVKDIVEEAATYGIYVLADMHQEPIQWMYRWYLGAWPKPWVSINFYERILC